QFAMLLAAATYVIYGAADMAMESGEVLSTRFRFMIAVPLMATFFALSFRPFARRHSQAFIMAFGVMSARCSWSHAVLRTGASASTERHSRQSSAMIRRSQEPSAMADLSSRRRRRWGGCALVGPPPPRARVCFSRW